MQHPREARRARAHSRYTDFLLGHLAGGESKDLGSMQRRVSQDAWFAGSCSSSSSSSSSPAGAQAQLPRLLSLAGASSRCRAAPAPASSVSTAFVDVGKVSEQLRQEMLLLQRRLPDMAEYEDDERLPTVIYSSERSPLQLRPLRPLRLDDFPPAFQALRLEGSGGDHEHEQASQEASKAFASGGAVHHHSPNLAEDVIYPLTTVLVVFTSTLLALRALRELIVIRYEEDMRNAQQVVDANGTAAVDGQDLSRGQRPSTFQPFHGAGHRLEEHVEADKQQELTRAAEGASPGAAASSERPGAAAAAGTAPTAAAAAEGEARADPETEVPSA
eukprot:TRINITY_DN11969_c0_g1_i1.p1 TRINITY_DN11969_c0_g1~~TRINITY_DN11969_c0_g1_i1.p1  ORF type:complete len:331 (+),score=77.91 TRINITY_DN11969_c0_g1_i1:129-1121(+)